MESLLNKGK